MKKELPAPVVIGVAIIALLLALGLGFYFLNRPEPTRSEVPGGSSPGKSGGKRAPDAGQPGV